MIVPFASGAQSPNCGSHEEPPASHVGRPHPSHPSSAAGLRLTVTTGVRTCSPSGSGRRASLRRSPTASLRGRPAEKDHDVAAADGLGRDRPPGCGEDATRSSTSSSPWRCPTTSQGRSASRSPG